MATQESNRSLEASRLGAATKVLLRISVSSLTLLLLLEVGARIVLALSAASTREIDLRTTADSVDPVWAEQYFRELEASGQMQWKSYVYWRRKPYSGAYINVDSAGVRRSWRQARWPETNPDSSVTSVLFLGGSTMWGTGARDDSTIASHFARLAALKGREVAVRNLGESGYTSFQDLLTLVKELRLTVPDAVVMYSGFNDVFSSFQNRVAGLPQNESTRVREFNLTKLRGGRTREILSHALRLAAGELAIVRVIETPIDKLLFRRAREAARKNMLSESLATRLAGETVEHFKSNLRVAKALSAEYGFRLYSFWHPTVFGKDSLSAYEKERRHDVAYIAPFLSDVYAKVGVDSSLVNDSTFTDLQSIFRDSTSAVFLDFCHLSEAGNRAVAERMLQVLWPELKPPEALNVSY